MRFFLFILGRVKNHDDIGNFDMSNWFCELVEWRWRWYCLDAEVE